MVNTSKDAAMEEREEFMVSPIDDDESSNSRWIEDESNPIIRAPLHFVQLWAWERFPNLQPKASIVNSGEPRVARWQKNSITHIEYQCNLDSIKMCLVVWIMLGEIMTDRLKMLNSMYLPGYSESDVSKRYLEWWNNQNVGNIQDCEMRVIKSSSDDDNLPISEFSRRRKLKKKEITVVTGNQEPLRSTQSKSSSALNDGTATAKETLMESKLLSGKLETSNGKSEESDEDDPSVVKEMVSLESKYNNDKGGCKLNLPDSLELASGGPNANQSEGRYAKFSSSTPAKMHLQMSKDSVEAPKVNTNGINRTEGMDMGNMNTHEKGSSRFELKDIPKLEMRLRNLESIIARKVPRVRTK
ncbi:hypothetical protein RND71_037656 [Anisodus tanguticus]|uniref:Aminotransferase-like plant mobile domain-containing protein n=1 Tax=Anisodus tanguticus TaxID=243964 RepID=A0AAE1QY73_9SOLA|nr:hypothetical protein RND71_037656 [Anisodus tanguticus]